MQKYAIDFWWLHPQHSPLLELCICVYDEINKKKKLDLLSQISAEKSREGMNPDRWW